MSIVIPMWFIWLWAICLVIGLVKTFKTTNELMGLAESVAKIITPKLEESLSESIGTKLAVKLNDELNDEYIVVKKPVRKAKKEEVKDAEVH